MKEREREPTLQPFERVPDELKARPQWVNWRMDDGRKVPVNPATLGNAGVGWPNTWASFQHTVEIAAHHNLGIGFVLTEEDFYSVVDLDGCVGKKGRISTHTREILDLLAGWVELSPSGAGLHIWVRNEQPVNRRTQGIEVYSNARWMTVTGRSHPQASPVIPARTAQLAELVRRYFPQPEAAQPVSVPCLPLADDEIWARLFNSKNGAFFASLFQGDTSVCYHDHSRAVILLANQLAAMTNLDRPGSSNSCTRPAWSIPNGKQSAARVPGLITRSRMPSAM